MAKPPYQQIADDIRALISSGELSPGDRVPSARQITAKWGVAIATATKVLALLQQEGAVTVVPGVGTVVSGLSKVGRPSKRDHGGLSRERIVAMALDIADAEGLSALSMRRIALELGVATMGLYRYVRGKDDLLLHMIDTVFGEIPMPKRPEGWRLQLDAAARHTWAMFKRHRWLAPVMSLTRPQLAPNALSHTDWVLKSVEGLGLGHEAMIHIHVMLFSYVRGIATSLEAEAEAEQDTGLTNDEWMQGQEAILSTLAASSRYSTVVKLMLETELDLDLDSLFEFGLARLLDGIAVLIASPPAPKGGRSRRAGSRR
ncbi:TetR/AcrR family transcriptional regulator C-terminal domain-containing protein [Catelliglobosispora koreensis]|uniref:TetR/AcrR family transcriptional regulator C-terminal domain-containing protein n=1 Tax=Catelliglobosispora koreensis TaxID=129052 RepID=UPI000363BE6F|nr:TetR/AcrR family transcriptional regulator C-terminal domain-containing protein [Catelliglobosispora koreensis]